MKNIVKHFRLDNEMLKRLDKFKLNNADGYRQLISQSLFIMEELQENNIDLNFINHIFKMGINKYLEDEKYYK